MKRYEDMTDDELCQAVAQLKQEKERLQIENEMLEQKIECIRRECDEWRRKNEAIDALKRLLEKYQ